MHVRVLLLVGSACASACLFPSLDGLSVDAGTPDANGADVSVADAADASDASTSDAKDSAVADASTDSGVFTAGIGCKAANSDLLAYYTVDEGTGAKIYDCIASASSGDVLYSAHTVWVTGQHGGALELDPFTGVCVTVDFATPTFTFGGGANTSAPFTVAMWIKVLSLPVPNELGYIVGQSSNPAAAGWRVSLTTTGAVMLSMPDGKGGIANVSGPGVSVNVWQHIAIAYGGGSADIFVDAAKSALGPMPAKFTADTNPDHMRIGCSADDQHQLHAQIDEVRFYDRALDAAEVLAVKNAQ